MTENPDAWLTIDTRASAHLAEHLARTVDAPDLAAALRVMQLIAATPGDDLLQTVPRGASGRLVVGREDDRVTLAVWRQVRSLVQHGEELMAVLERAAALVDGSDAPHGIGEQADQGRA